MRIRFVFLLGLAACRHAPATPASSRAASGGDVGVRAQPLPQSVAELSSETHALLRAEGELLWTRWTTGSGPLPSSALAEHLRLTRKDALDAVSAASAQRPGDLSLQILQQQLATLAVSREAGPQIDAVERARAQLAFAAPGDARPERAERDLDRLLTDEPSAQKRAAIALAEAKAAQPLATLVLARDEAEDSAIASLGLGSWVAMEERMHRMSVADLAALAERTLIATEEVASKAVAATSVRNLGVTPDRIRRADLPRLLRSALADPQFAAGRAWPRVQDVIKGMGLALPGTLRVDAEPSPSKGARPLALLIDPPGDVRLSLRPAGGYEEQRATLHEGARAAGGALTSVPTWELAQLGDGSAAEAVAQLFEELAGDPAWLREVTQLRGESLDDVVHTQAVRRLLTARRAAALVLFEIQRRQGPHTAEAQAALYRGLIQRATFAPLSDEDASRWALEASPWTASAVPLLGAVLAAQLETRKWADGAPWWKSQDAGAALRKVWAGGRSMTALEAARALGLTQLDPVALAQAAAAQLAYSAPEAPPTPPKPDYKYMQGDKKRRRTRRHKKH